MVAVVDCTFGRAFVLVVVVVVVVVGVAGFGHRFGSSWTFVGDDSALGFVVGSVVVASAAYFAYGMIVTAVVRALILRMDWGCGWELIELWIVAFVVVVVVFVIVV